MANLDKLSPISSNSAAGIRKTQPVTRAAVSPAGQILAAGGNDSPATTGLTAMNKVSKEELSHAVKRISGYIQNITRELNFSIDEELGKTIVTVLDEKTGEVIRQIPSEDMLELSRNLSEIRERTSRGLLFKGDA